MPIENYLLVVLALCLAALVHGFTGFGYAMVAMALLPLLVDLPLALFLGAVFMLPVAAILFIRFRRDFAWRDCWPLLAGVVAGTPLGLLLVEHLDRMLLIRGLGVVLLVFSLNELFLADRWPLPIPASLAFPIGVLCGVLGAAFNIGGPPAVVWVQSRKWERAKAIATLQMMYLFNSGLRVLLTLPRGEAAEKSAIIGLIAIVPFLLLALTGNRLAELVPRRRFKQIVLIALAMMGAYYLVR